MQNQGIREIAENTTLTTISHLHTLSPDVCGFIPWCELVTRKQTTSDGRQQHWSVPMTKIGFCFVFFVSKLKQHISKDT